jgi:DNA-binding transcriptional MocR family regulator
MTMWLPDLAPWPGPRYRALSEVIAQDIATGALPEGTRLPPQRDLAYRLGVTVGTVSRAYALVAERGLVSAEVGRGTYVRARRSGQSRPDPVGDGGDDLIKLTLNAPPDPSYRALLAQGLAEISTLGPLDDFMSYTPKRGFADHRAAAAAWIGRVGLDAPPDQIIITGGAHQAIVAAFAGLARPGDSILVEALTYAGVCHIAERLGLRLHGLAIDDEGLLPAALEEAARTGQARLLFINPTVHNPTTASMSLARREAIAGIARRHDLIVIEDDVYGQLPEDRPPPLAALVPERTIHISGASKSVAPGLRLGVLLSPASLHERIADAQHDLFLTCPPLLAELFRYWVANGTADQLARRQRLEAGARQRVAHEALGSHHYRAQPTSYHLWLPLPPPWRTAEFLGVVRERGVAIDPGSAFAVERMNAPHAVRVSLSAAASRERLARALQILARTLDEAPARRREVI